MKESVRRIILFAVIVGVGSLLVLVNIPLVLLLPLVIGVGILLLVLLGALPVAEIRANLAKAGAAVKKFGNIEIGKKKKKETAPPAKAAPAPAKSAPAQKKSSGIGIHIGSLVSSVKSLGKILTERKKKPVKKVDEIDKLLDKTVSEKVSKTSGSALASAATMPGSTPPPAPAGGGMAAEMPAAGDDPFLSLSDEEFDAGLLDGLDGDDAAAAPATAAAEPPGAAAPPTPGPETEPSLSIGDADMPPLPDDLAAAAGDILKAHGADDAGGLEEFKGLGGGAAADESFGELDSINLDDVDIGDEEEEEKPAAAPAPAPLDAAAGGAAAAPAAAGPVKQVVINSDYPGDAVSTEADMSSFAVTPSGTDDDMLSSLASEIKTVKKDVDVSLVRELKDFRAPATEIEKDLSEIHQRLDSAAKKRTDKNPVPGGIK